MQFYTNTGIPPDVTEDQNMSQGTLLLEDGALWEGEAFGASTEALGEAVFNTAFAGYEEVLTDPSYAGQIVVMSTPHVGNYGITMQDMESGRCHLRGFVVKEAVNAFSSWRGEKSLAAFLGEQNVFGLSGVDTRGIVKHLRKNGAMRAILSAGATEKETLLRKVRSSPSMNGASFLKEVTAGEISRHENAGPRVALYDFGMKRNILQSLIHENFEVFVLPAFTPAKEALALKPDAIVFSNGPGDPAASGDIVETVKTLAGSGIPVLGICLGHQLLARALGAQTYKLKFGHRGVNHPVKNVDTGEVAITSHNHGFAVEAESLPARVIPTYTNLYDATLEGFRHLDLPIQAVQFHPEAAPGPRDAMGLFAGFKSMLAS